MFFNLLILSVLVRENSFSLKLIIFLESKEMDLATFNTNFFSFYREKFAQLKLRAKNSHNNNQLIVIIIIS